MAEAAFPATSTPARSLFAGNALPIAVFLIFAMVPLFATFKAEAYVGSAPTRSASSARMASMMR